MRSVSWSGLALIFAWACSDPAEWEPLEEPDGSEIPTGGGGSSGGGTPGGPSVPGEPNGSGGSQAEEQPGSGGSTSEEEPPGGEEEPDPVCKTSQPPSDMLATLEATWQEMLGEVVERGEGARAPHSSVLRFTNSILDQVMASGGSLNYCVRYESDVVVSAALRDKIEAAVQRGINEWFSKIRDYDCFPFDEIDVKITGWAAMNRSTFAWADGDHPGRMYIGDNSFENAPQCAQSCGRFFERNKPLAQQYQNCPGGAEQRYDMSLWLTEGMAGGAGGDWGQRMGRAYFTNSVDQASQHIFAHEIGHGFGFPDYYNWGTWFPGLPAPQSVMVVGRSSSVSEWDAWMLRHTWTELKAERGW